MNKGWKLTAVVLTTLMFLSGMVSQAHADEVRDDRTLTPEECAELYHQEQACPGLLAITSGQERTAAQELGTFCAFIGAILLLCVLIAAADGPDEE